MYLIFQSIRFFRSGSVLLGFFAALLVVPQIQSRTVLPRVGSESANFRVVEVVGGLEHPWAVAFLPDGDLLITERPGRLRLFRNGRLHHVSGLPEITPHGQGGLMDVYLHPLFAENQVVFLSYSARYEGGVATRAIRAKLHAGALELHDVELIFSMTLPSNHWVHFGSRFAMDADGNLFISLGDRGQRYEAQNLQSHQGTLIRIRPDGTIPGDNPFVGHADILPEIFSYGHRNAQGLVIDPETGHIWQHEHGPQGGDTLNRVQPGKNYGWPIATYGEEYGGGRIGRTPPEVPDVVEPFHYWVPSIAPSGLALYRGDKFPGWEGNLLVGALVQQHVQRLVLEGDKVVRTERLLEGRVGRIRDVRVCPEGFVYLVTDQRNGSVFRLEPIR